MAFLGDRETIKPKENQENPDIKAKRGGPGNSPLTPQMNLSKSDLPPRDWPCQQKNHTVNRRVLDRNGGHGTLRQEGEFGQPREKKWKKKVSPKP